MMIIPMPIDKDGNGPADKNETVKVLYEIWDDDFQTVSTHESIQEAIEALTKLQKADK